VEYEIGTVLFNEWEITNVLAKGGMANVYGAEHKETHKRAVLKVAPFGLYKHLGLPITQEADIMRAYGNHPGLPELYDAWVEEECLHLLMEYCGRKTLQQECEERLNPHTAEEVRALLLGILPIVRHLHTREAPIYHLDLKPGNILIDARGSIRLIDFGISYQAGGARWTPTPGTTIGTWGYVPPEQLLCDKMVMNHRADIYNVGVIGYRLITGKHRVDPNSPMEFYFPPRITLLKRLVEWVDGGRLYSALARALDMEPENRFQSADEFIAALSS
jgi:serine/threonine-protein kinase